MAVLERLRRREMSIEEERKFEKGGRSEFKVSKLGRWVDLLEQRLVIYHRPC